LGIIIPEGKSVKGNKYVGALVGSSNNLNGVTANTVITNCFASGTTEENRSIGGLVGLLNWANTAIQNCYTAGNVRGLASDAPADWTANGAGGIVGGYWGRVSVTIEKCYSTSYVSSYNYSGGILGEAAASGSVEELQLTISNCVALNNAVDGDIAAHRVLGLAKSGTTITLTDNYGYADTYIGMGSEEEKGLTANGGADILKNDVAKQASYSGWDFETPVWTMGNGSYALPVLNGLSATLQPQNNPAHFEGVSSIGKIGADHSVYYSVGILYVKEPGTGVKIYNATGRLVMQGSESKYDISSFPTGIYLVKTAGATVKILK
jgi:hypothetical protein